MITTKTRYTMLTAILQRNDSLPFSKSVFGKNPSKALKKLQKELAKDKVKGYNTRMLQQPVVFEL